MTDITFTGRERSLLHDALRLDAAVSGANGLAYLVAADALADVLGLSPGLLRGAGALLVAFAAGVLVAGPRRKPPAAAVRAIVAVNVVWAVDSLVAAAAGWGSPTTAGT